MNQQIEQQASPIQLIEFAGREIFIKRDDLLEGYINGKKIKGFNGNKARKFAYLLGEDMTDTVADSSAIVSYGSAQSNSLPVLAAVAAAKHLRLDFYVNHIASWLQQHPIGNYAQALDLAANVICAPQNVDLVVFAQNQLGIDDLWVPEGGHQLQAKFGVEQLADELITWFEQMDFERLNVMLPSGTGTTAVLLQQRFALLAYPITVYTCACVGDDDYLRQQFSELVFDKALHPCIVKADKKYHFGRLHIDFYTTWRQLFQQTQIEFELLYDPLAWLILLQHFAGNVGQLSQKVPLVYIHQGGVAGNKSMLRRYQRKFEVAP